MVVYLQVVAVSLWNTKGKGQKPMTTQEVIGLLILIVEVIGLVYKISKR